MFKSHDDVVYNDHDHSIYAVEGPYITVLHDGNNQTL